MRSGFNFDILDFYPQFKQNCPQLECRCKVVHPKDYGHPIQANEEKALVSQSEHVGHASNTLTVLAPPIPSSLLHTHNCKMHIFPQCGTVYGMLIQGWRTTNLKLKITDRNQEMRRIRGPFLVQHKGSKKKCRGHGSPISRPLTELDKRAEQRKSQPPVSWVTSWPTLAVLALSDDIFLHHISELLLAQHWSSREPVDPFWPCADCRA